VLGGLKRVQPAIDIEVEATWPAEFLAEARKHRALIIDYQRERQRIDRLVQDDVIARTYPPSNRYDTAYRDLVSRLEPELMPHRLVGYHCTRLTSREIAEIESGGMRMLTPQLVAEKIAGCVKDGHLTSDRGDFLLHHGSQIAALRDQHGRRTGMLWFCANNSTLRISSRVYRLFRYWGGEATRGSPAGHPEILREIAHIGTPCIVKCAIPFVDVQQNGLTFVGRFLSRFVASEVEYPHPQADFDFHTEIDLAGANVLKVIEFANAEFEDLTGSAGWCENERINLKQGRSDYKDDVRRQEIDDAPRIATRIEISQAEWTQIGERLDREV
jgi:hypothetical protein